MSRQREYEYSSSERKPPVSGRFLLIGIGNENRGDDGVGLIAARMFRKTAPPGITILEQSGEAMALLDAWQGASAVVLVDAVRSGKPSGTILRWERKGIGASGKTPEKTVGAQHSPSKKVQTNTWHDAQSSMSMPVHKNASPSSKRNKMLEHFHEERSIVVREHCSWSYHSFMHDRSANCFARQCFAPPTLVGVGNSLRDPAFRLGRASTHDFGVAEAIQLANSLNCLPPQLVIYGIEARSFDPGTSTSTEANAAIHRIQKFLRNEFQALLSGSSQRRAPHVSTGSVKQTQAGRMERG